MSGIKNRIEKSDDLRCLGKTPAPASNYRPNMPIDAKPRVGRLQRDVRRCFIAADGRPLTISDFLPRCYPRVQSFSHWQYRAVGRAARQFGVPLGRAESRQGRPVIWIPNDELRRLINNETADLSFID
jgi:hypothetical protein